MTITITSLIRKFVQKPIARMRIHFIYRRLCHKKTILDIGAFRGEYTDFFLKFKPKRIYCFEPQKHWYDFLEAKYQDNDKVVVFNFAIGKEYATEKLYICSSNNDISSMSRTFVEKNRQIGFNYDREEEIVVKTLDMVLKSLDLENEKLFIKIDTEDSEQEILSTLETAINCSFEVHSFELEKAFAMITRMPFYARCRFNFIVGLDKKPIFDSFVTSEQLISYLLQKRNHSESRRWNGEVIVMFQE